MACLAPSPALEVLVSQDPGPADPQVPEHTGCGALIRPDLMAPDMH